MSMIAAAAGLLLGAAGCTWTHDDYPDRRCAVNADCFRAQGEICDPEAGVCVTAADAAAPADAAGAQADASPPDAATVEPAAREDEP